MFKNLLKRLFIFLFIIFLWLLAEKRTDGFRTSKIIFDLPSYWRTPDLTIEEYQKINAILNQKFKYLGRGRQCFVFESETHEYVLKFINFSNVSYPAFLKMFPLAPLKKSLARKDERFPQTFASLALAFEKLKDETALVYVHLDGKKINNKVEIKNKYGQTFGINLNETCFIIQKKAKPLFLSLEEFFLKEKEKGLEKGIDEFLNVIVARCKKNIADDDFNAEMNIGFIDGKALIIDTGKLYPANLENKEAFKGEILLSTKFLRRWLEKNHLEALPYLEKRIEETLKML